MKGYFIAKSSFVAEVTFKVNLVSSSVNLINVLEKTSSWKKIERIMAIIMRYKETLLNLAKKRIANRDGPIVDINLLQKGETEVIKLYQKGAFQKEVQYTGKWKGYFKPK